MNTELRKQAKNDFEKNFLKLMNNFVFGKTTENVRKHRDIKLATTNKRRDQLVSESNYHKTKLFSENLLAIEMKKIKIKINKPVYADNVKLCYMDTDSSIMLIKIEDFYKDIVDGVEKRFDTANYEINRP